MCSARDERVIADSTRQVMLAAAKPVNTRAAASPAYECTKSDLNSATIPTARNDEERRPRSQRGSQ